MLIGSIYMFGVVLLWSITPIFVKLLLPTTDPFVIAFLRLAQGIAVLCAVHLARGGRLSHLFPRDRWTIIGGIGVGVNYTLFTLGLSFTSAAAGALMVQFQYVTLAILAAIVLGEAMGIRRIIGISAVIAGAAVIAMTQGAMSDSFSARMGLGNAIMLVSGIGWGMYALSSRALAGTRGSLEIVLPMLVLGIIPTGLIVVFGDVRNGPWTARDVILMFFLGTFATGMSFWLSAEGLKMLSAAYAGTITGTTPLIQLVLARLVLGESLSYYLLIGAALVIGGVITMGLAERSGSARTRSVRDG